MTLLFAVVHEAEADFLIATELADRVLIDVIEWLDDELLANQRQWVGTIPTNRRLKWTGVSQMAREHGIKAHGHFGGEPGEPDAAAARRAILFLREVLPDLSAILLIRDQDDQIERRLGLEQARNENHGGIKIVIGLAIVEREAWVISGFEPLNDSEKSRLDAARQTLGFDPRLKSQELTACKDPKAKRSPKLVLQQLSNGNGERERSCWMSTPLALLRARGCDNGLTPYLDEIRERIAPMIGYITGQ